MTKIAVIGAGPAGLSAAYFLSKHNYSVDVFEVGSDVGGLAKSIELWGQIVDLGPHRFYSTNNDVLELWNEILKDECVTVKRLTRIYYKKKFFLYPLNFIDLITKFSIIEFFAILASYLYGQLFVHPDKRSLKSWLVKKFGFKLFDMFFRRYSEKLWGLSCDNIDADFAAQRIKRLSLAKLMKSLFLKSNLRTMIDEFQYPKYGAGYLYKRLAAEILKRGNNIHFNTKIAKIITKDNAVCGLLTDDGTVKDYDHIISSMPLTSLVSGIDSAPKNIKEACNKLTFRNTILVYLKVNQENLYPDNWIYINDPDLDVGRITNFRNWSPYSHSNHSETILCMEYWAYSSDELWKAEDSELISKAIEEIKSTGLVESKVIITEGKVLRLPRSYPVYKLGYQNEITIIKEFLEKISGLEVIGRYGTFKYNNQDHSILMGIMSAKNIIFKSNYNLWNVNSDVDKYLEDGELAESIVDDGTSPVKQ